MTLDEQYPELFATIQGLDPVRGAKVLAELARLYREQYAAGRRDALRALTAAIEHIEEQLS